MRSLPPSPGRPRLLFHASLLFLLGWLAGSMRAASGVKEFILDVWETDRGLPQNTVNSLAQTSDGFLWVGTFNGLASFDGVSFQTVELEPTPGVSPREVYALFADRQGSLWAAAPGQPLARLRDGVWRYYGEPEGLPVLGYTRLAEDASGRLIVSRADHAYRMEGDRFVPFPRPGMTNRILVGSAVDPKGILWGLTRDYCGGLSMEFGNRRAFR